MERRGILPITLLVVVGEIAAQVWGIVTGFLSFLPMLPTFAMQIMLIGLFAFDYHKSGETYA